MCIDNARVHTENENLSKANMQFNSQIRTFNNDISDESAHAAGFGDNMARWDSETHSLNIRKRKSAKIEKKLDRDMTDLIEYTKWISGETEKLRNRVRSSESVINDLRQSGEASVENLMESLYMFKIRAEEGEAKAEE